MKLIDDLYCYFFLYCKEKAWFANDSYGTYAWGSLGIFIFVFLILLVANLDLIFETKLLDIFIGVWGEGFVSLQVIQASYLLIIWILLAIYLVKDRRAKKLTSKIDFDNVESKKYFYKLGTAFVALIVVLFINLSIFSLIERL